MRSAAGRGRVSSYRTLRWGRCIQSPIGDGCVQGKRRHSGFTAILGFCHAPKEKCLNSTLAHALRSLQRNILAGILAIAPLFVTYLIFSFVLGILANAGRPLLWLFSALFPDSKPAQPWVQFVVAILLTLVVLYVVGRVTSEFAGRRALGLFESALERLPIVAKIYGSVRQLVDNMTAKKESSQRVVLVDFPIAGHKSIGFLSRTLTDSTSGEPLAA